MHTVTLKPAKTNRCLRGHCWIYRSELADDVELPDGGEVLVIHPRFGVIGSGLASARSQIAVRLLSVSGEAIDETLLSRRLDEAIARRDPQAGCSRLVWSEGDRLPGLIVDRYHDRLVVQATTVGMDQRLPLIVALLTAKLRPLQIVERNDAKVREREGLALRSGVLLGPSATTCEVTLGRGRWQIDLLDPHKTGAYLDQQRNQMAWADAIAAQLMRTAGSSRPRVADVCCHLGGFAIHAALAGATAVAVDQSAASVAGTRSAAALNHVADRVEAVEADAFAWLRSQHKERQRFAAIVLDPPSFAPNREAVAGALRGYRDLHVQALRLLDQGGLLATYTCSHHIDEATMLATITDAAADAKRGLRLLERHQQPPDHPIVLAIPETEYLRGWLFEVMEVR